MFRNKKEKEIDVTSLNHILRTGKKLMSIGYFMAILALIILGTFLIKEWKILGILKEFIIVISPIFIGFLVAWLFEPLVKKLQAKKVPRLLGCILSYLLILGVIFLIAYMFVPSLVTQIKDFVAAAPEIFKELTKFVTNIIEKFDTNHLINIKDVKKEITSIISNFGMGLVSNLPEYALSIGKSIINGGLNFVLGLMIGFYLLFDFDKVNENIDKMLPKTWKENFRELTKRINTSLRSYVQGVLLVMFLVFLTQSIGLTLAGMEAPLLFALFCAVTDIIPYFGPYIGGIPAVIVGFTISPITGICVLISILVVQLLENNFYQPLIMGHTMQLHPVTIMLGLLIFEHFFGILGMVIATPVIACIKVLLIFVNEKTGIIESITGEEIADLKELEEN